MSKAHVHGKQLTAQKAATMLHDGTVRGHKISDKQRKFFGAIASGAVNKSRKSYLGGMLSKRG